MGYGITGGLRDYESMQFGGLKDKYYSSGLIWRYDNENEPELVGSRCRSLKYSARTVSLWGTCTKTGPVERNGAYKRSRLRSLPERWTALFSLSLPFYLPPSLFLSTSLPRSRLSIGLSVFVRPPSQNSVPHVFSTQEFLTSSSYQVQKPVLPLSLHVVRDRAQIIDRVGERCRFTTSGLSSLPILKHLFVRIFSTLDDKGEISNFRISSKVMLCISFFSSSVKRCNSMI